MSSRIYATGHKAYAMFLFMAALILPQAALALSQEEATALAADIQSEYELMLYSSGFQPQIDGTVAARVNGDGYDIVIPAASMALDAQGGRVSWGRSFARMTPLDGDVLDVKMQIPTEYRFYSGQQATGRMVIGMQDINLLWSEEFEMTQSSDMRLGNIQFFLPDGESFMRIQGVTGSSALGEVTNGIADMAMNFMIENMSIHEPDGPGTMLISAINLDIDVEAMDIAELVAQQKAYFLLGEAAAQGRPAEELSQMSHAVFSEMDVFEDAQIDFILSGISLNSAMGGFQLQEMKFEESFQPGEGGFYDFGMGMSYEGLNVPSMAAHQAVFPKGMGLHIGFADVPLADVMAEVFAIQPVAQEMQSGGKPSQADMQAMELMGTRLLQIMQEAGVEIEISDTWVRTGSLSSAAEGRFRFMADAAMGIAGQLSASIAGLDAFSNALSANPNMPNAGEYIMTVNMLRGFGQPDGRGNHGYTFSLTPQGGLLLNGMDLSALVGGMGMPR